MAVVYLGLGSNLGDRETNIREALERLSEHPAIRVVRASSLYETDPMGITDQPEFINAVAEVETDLAPVDLLHAIISIEKEMGRVRNFRWGPRVIDMDVLLCDNAVIDAPELKIPHPRMMERAFVLIPLLEIAPEIELPGGKSREEALDSVKDQRIRKLAEVA